MTKRSKIILVTVLMALVVVAVSTTVGYAIWTGTLNPTARVTLTAGQPIEITFGADGDSAITDPITPGGTVVSSANMKCSGKDLNVTFKIAKVEVKLKGEEVFKDCTKQSFFTMTTSNFSGRLTNTEQKVDFEFLMRENVDATYVEAEFRITVTATGSIASA